MMEPIDSDDKNLQEEKPKETQPTVSLGKRFITARNEMGKSIIEVANHLHLAAHVIDDIENDNYSRIASDVYAKGYLRTYAKFVRIPENEVLEQYSAMELGKTIVAKQPQLIMQKPPIVNPNQQRWITYSLMGIFLIGFIYWWTSGAGDSDESALLVFEEKKPVIIERPVREVKKVEEAKEIGEEKLVKKNEEKKEINVATKIDEPDISNDSQSNKPLIVSPEDILSG